MSRSTDHLQPHAARNSSDGGPGPSPAAPGGEGCLRTLLAGITGVAAFVVCVWLGSTLGNTNPGAGALLGWLGAGGMLALTVSLVAPARRWLVGLPLLLFAETCPIVPLALASGYAVAEPGMLWGMVLGVALGIAVLYALDPVRHAARFRVVAVVLPVTFVVALLVSGWSGAGDLTRSRQEVLPAFEQFVAQDVLVRSEPVAWDEPQRVHWQSGAGLVYVGRMRRSGVNLMLVTSRRLVGRPGRLDGLTVTGLEIQIPQTHSLRDSEKTEPLLRKMLTDEGVRPELIACLGRRGASDGTYLVGARHGIEFAVSSMYNGRDNTTLKCTGVYSSSAP